MQREAWAPYSFCERARKLHFPPIQRISLNCVTVIIPHYPVANNFHEENILPTDTSCENITFSEYNCGHGESSSYVQAIHSTCFSHIE